MGPWGFRLCYWGGDRFGGGGRRGAVAHMSWQKHGVWLLLVLTALIYAPLYRAGFVWDDSALVVDNALTGDLWGTLGAIFKTDLWRTLKLAGADSGYYRPLMLLSLAVDRALFGLSAPAHHIHNVLWHVACVGGVYAVIQRLAGVIPALGGAALLVSSGFFYFFKQGDSSRVPGSF